MLAVTDLDIFQAHAKKYEAEFLEDMKVLRSVCILSPLVYCNVALSFSHTHNLYTQQALGVRDPDVLTRVSEYVPHIIDMVKKIIDNGMVNISVKLLVPACLSPSCAMLVPWSPVHRAPLSFTQ